VISYVNSLYILLQLSDLHSSILTEWLSPSDLDWSDVFTQGSLKGDLQNSDSVFFCVSVLKLMVATNVWSTKHLQSD
jgi:hypothetical protein